MCGGAAVEREKREKIEERERGEREIDRQRERGEERGEKGKCQPYRSAICSGMESAVSRCFFLGRSGVALTAAGAVFLLRPWSVGGAACFAARPATSIRTLMTTSG